MYDAVRSTSNQLNPLLHAGPFSNMAE